MELSFPGTFVPWNLRSLNMSYLFSLSYTCIHAHYSALLKYQITNKNRHMEFLLERIQVLIAGVL